MLGSSDVKKVTCEDQGSLSDAALFPLKNSDGNKLTRETRQPELNP